MSQSLTWTKPMVSVALVVTALMCAFTSDGSDEPQRSPERMVPWGDFRVPMMRPAWGEDPLEIITSRLQEGNPLSARSLLERLIAEFNGRLILPAGSDPKDLERVDRPDRVLGEWFASLGALQEHLSSGEILRDVEELHCAAPVLWHPALRDAARKRFESALERAEWKTVQLIATSPNAPVIDSDLRDWLNTQMWSVKAGAVAVVSPSHELPEKLQQVYSLPLVNTVDFKPSPTEPKNVRRIETRRLPLARIEPTLDGTTILFNSGSRCFAIETSHKPRLIWQVGPLPGMETAPALQDEVSQAIVHGPLLFIRRRRADWLENQTTFSLNHFQRTSKNSLYNDLMVLKRSAAAQQPRIVGRRFLEHSAGAGIEIHDGRVYVPLWRGWNLHEFAIGALDARSGDELWVRVLGSRSRSWHSSNDLRDKIPRATLIPYRGSLVVLNAFGWVARLGAERGDDRGVLRYPRHQWSSMLNGATNLPMRLKGMYAPRTRYPGPPVFVPESDGSPPLLVVLPPDAQHLFAIDLNAWRIVWRHPASRSTFLVGVQKRDGGQDVLLFDAGTPIGETTAGLRHIDSRSGRVVCDPVTLDLSAGPSLPAAEDDPTAAVLVGMPKVVGEALWVPTLAGLEVWDLRALEPGARLGPQRVLPWPVNSRGGTVTPLPGGRLLCISRGNAARRATSFIEIFEGKGKPGKNKQR